MEVFYVFQGTTYEVEKAGGYIWSPQLAKNGKKNIGFSNMTKIKKGDFILHNQNGKIVAISMAVNDCEEGDKPRELMEDVGQELWNKEGYKVKLTYYPFDVKLETSNLRKWLKDNYRKDSAFTTSGKGKQQYMCTLNDEHAIYILTKIKKEQYSEKLIFIIDQAILSITDQIKISNIEDLYRYSTKFSTEFGGRKISSCLKINWKCSNLRNKELFNIDYSSHLKELSNYNMQYDTKMMSEWNVSNLVVGYFKNKIIVEDAGLFVYDISDTRLDEFEKTDLFKKYNAYQIMFIIFETSTESITINDKFRGIQILSLKELLSKDNIKEFWLNLKNSSNNVEEPIKLVEKNSDLVVTIKQKYLGDLLLDKKRSNKLMKIKEVVINRYKALKNINIEFSDNDLHVLIGNNGTNKTTLFEVIKEAFNSDEKKGNYAVTFVENGISKIINSNDPEVLNRDVKIFSYALVDRTSDATYISSIRKFSTYLIEYVLSGKRNLDFVLDKIGITTNNFYIGFTNYTIVKRKAKVQKMNLKKIEEIIVSLDNYISQDRLTKILNELNDIAEELDERQSNIEDFYFRIFKNLILSNEKRISIKHNNTAVNIEAIKKNKIDFLNFIELTTLIGFVNPIREIWCVNNEESYRLSELSTGEFSYLYRMLSIYSETKDGTIVLIDEPEVHLHPKWIVSYLSDLRRVLKNKKVFIIIATHSPLIINNIDNNQLINFYKNDNGEVSVKVEKTNQLFANNTDKILDHFFNVRGNDSEIIRDFFKDISFLIESGRYSEAKVMLKKLPMTVEKMKFIDRYYDEIQSEEFSNE